MPVPCVASLAGSAGGEVVRDRVAADLRGGAVAHHDADQRVRGASGSGAGDGVVIDYGARAGDRGGEAQHLVVDERRVGDGGIAGNVDPVVEQVAVADRHGEAVEVRGL